jgi:hypothetical protein
MQELTAPSKGSALRFDTSTHIHATDEDGKVIIGDDNKPIHIAQDLSTGKWYAKIADSMPFNGKDKKAAAAKLKDIQDAGGIHIPHPFERFRGVWAPIPEKPSRKAS